MALALAAAFPALSHAVEPPEPIVVLNEAFDNVAALGGWSLINNSSPPGQNWFQGNADIFRSHAGPRNAYIAANFLSALNGVGNVDNWLITPALTLIGPSELSFFTRRAAAPGFSDVLEVLFSEGSGTDLAGFSLLGTIGATGGYPTTWTEIVADIDYEGTGRFAFRYIGDAAASNYLGLDTVVITTVPEPGAYLMLLIGLGGLVLLRRKQMK